MAALLAGAAALYFVFAERWGVWLVGLLRGQEQLFGFELGGPWTVAAPAVFITISMAVIVKVQRKWFPGTEGTGIPQSIAALRIGERPERMHMLSVRIAIGKVILLTIALLSGITVGREGPSVQVGAALMHVCTRVVRLPAHIAQRGLILAGSAAGIAAAFNSPVAGVIFCFEEVGRRFDRNVVPIVIRTVAIAVAVTILLLGEYLFYTDANATAHLPLGLPWKHGWRELVEEVRQWAVVPMVGLIGGFLGGWFGRGVVVVSRFTGPWLARRPFRVGLVFGACLAVIAIVSSGESYTGGYGQAKEMLVSAAATDSSTAVWYYPLAKAAASFVSLVSLIPGGLFDPSLAVGAGLGQVAFPLVHNVISPTMGLPELMMLFMAAYFAGVVQSPITVFAILFEMTGAYGMILPLMFASIIGSMVAGRICRPSIYEALAIHFLSSKGLSGLVDEEDGETAKGSRPAGRGDPQGPQGPQGPQQPS